jgi:hypothetical protein
MERNLALKMRAVAIVKAEAVEKECEGGVKCSGYLNRSDLEK